MAVQEICPVSGQQLGAHGKPIKVKIGEEQLFLCCRGCLQQKVNPEHWATIHANFAKAQAKCPVMDKPLPDKPKWTIVEGQIVYICCPPCAKKLAADPKTYLQKVDELYSRVARSQTQHALGRAGSSRHALNGELVSYHSPTVIGVLPNAAGGRNQTGNSKAEYRNTKQMQHPNVSMTKTPQRAHFVRCRQPTNHQFLSFVFLSFKFHFSRFGPPFPIYHT